MLKEFREFAMRGNVADMAVGIILGTAFSAIVASLVSDVLLPPIGLLVGGVDVSDLFLVLKGESPPAPYASLGDAKAADAVMVNYGVFVDTIVSFVIIAAAVFLLVKGMNRLRRREQAPPPVPTTKERPYGFSAIAMKATRCPGCTSVLEAA